MLTQSELSQNEGVIHTNFDMKLQKINNTKTLLGWRMALKRKQCQTTFKTVIW